MIGALAALLSRNGLIAAGAVTTVTLTGAGGYLSGTGQTRAPVIQVHVPPPVTKIQRVTVVKPSRTIIIRQAPRPHPAAQQPPAPPAPRPGGPAAKPPPPPRPPAACDKPPGRCRNSPTPPPAPRHP